jgi:hypothetical protein
MRTVAAAVALLAVTAIVPLAARASGGPAPVSAGPVPRAACGPGSVPELAVQGRVTPSDYASGRAARGLRCNTALVGQDGSAGGYRVYRYTDRAGHVCAFYDTTLLFPTNALLGSTHKTGVAVLDMSNPTHPLQTAMLVTPAMLSPHESLSLNVKRGLLAADLGNPFAYPGYVDLYSVAQDCRHPVLQSSLPVGVLGHEGTFSPDGRTFWVTSAGGGTLTAIDVSNPLVPVPIFVTRGFYPHGLNVSDDNNTLYFADLGYTGTSRGLTVLDVSRIQRRLPSPSVKVISHLTWPNVSIPQVPIPVTINHHPYLVEVDEFASNGSPLPSSAPAGSVGAARIIDIGDVRHPRVVSNIRLEVQMPRQRAEAANDPGASSSLQGYAGHYCAVPQRDEPGIVACSFIASGLRVFDIRDPAHPKELAYFTAPFKPGSSPSNYAMSAPAFDPQHGQIWYSDGNQGFFAVQLTNGVWPFK